MAVKGQRFELDLDADDFTFNEPQSNEDGPPFSGVIKEIQERDSDAVPSAPKMKVSKTGFPEPRQRRQPSAFKQRQQNQKIDSSADTGRGPSDQAILHHVAGKHGVDLNAAKEKAQISEENSQRINNMSVEDIEQARSELMSQMNPELLQRFLKRANIEEDQTKQWDGQEPASATSTRPSTLPVASEVKPRTDDTSEPQPNSSTSQALPSSSSSAADVHFPSPPRDPSKFVPLDPSHPDFLAQLRTHYFPDLPHDPNTLSWLQDPSDADVETSNYNPSAAGIAPSAIRFAFNGTLIPPSRSLEIPTSAGLHHHGDAPSSAGYTIPELSLLCRSSLPNQRCIAYQVLGRVFYRLGRGDFGPRGGELNEALWDLIERERPLELIMAEANKSEGKSHMSAKAYATEALWLWRKGGGGDRGILKEGQSRAK